MKVFKDIISGDEMFTDTYKFEEVEDAFYMVIGKNVTVKDDDIALEGANASTGDGEDAAPAEEYEAGSQSGIDVVMFMRLQETAFGNKKEYLTYMKGYLKTLKSKLNEEKPGSSEKLPAIQKPLQELLKNFKDLQFFTGESMNADGMIVIGDYKEVNGEEKPVLYFPKLGLLEEKL